MKQDKIITRRKFIKTAGAGAAASVISTSVFLTATKAKAQEGWRMAVVWSDPPPELELFTQMVSEGTDGHLRIKMVSAGEIGPFPETIEAVGKGTVEMGHRAPAYWARKVSVAAVLGVFRLSRDIHRQLSADKKIDTWAFRTPPFSVLFGDSFRDRQNIWLTCFKAEVVNGD